MIIDVFVSGAHYGRGDLALSRGSEGVVRRRDRIRAETIEEIRHRARQQLVADGVGGVSLRAIAREMGMASGALYRYYASLDELLAAVVADLFNEVAGQMEQARDALPDEDPVPRILAVCQAYRQWAVNHRAEFSLLFGTPLPKPARAEDGPVDKAAQRFGFVFYGLFATLWRQRPFAISDESEFSPDLLRQLRNYQATLPAGGLPLGALHVFLTCWTRLHGMVSLETFDHLDFALDNPDSFFQQQIRELVVPLDASVR